MRIINPSITISKDIIKRSLLYLGKAIVIFAIVTAATVVAQASIHDALEILAHTNKNIVLE